MASDVGGCKFMDQSFDPAACTYSQNDDFNPKDEDMTFCMSNYAKEAMKMMFMMRSHHMLTDVILEVKSELFHAHKVVLSAASPYFKAMFTGGLKESEMSRVKLQGVSILCSSHFDFELISFNNKSTYEGFS